ncbi:MAG: type II secretion system protein [Thermoguttaceae bacterium]
MRISKQRRGFTLVELLVVVAIIAILAGMIMVGGSAAFRTAREAATRMEMTNLERALEMYKTKYGEYPPDFSDYDAFERHFKKRWPRVNVNAYIPDDATGSDYPEKRTMGITNAINTALGTSFTYDAGSYTFPAEIKLSAIAFWLGGLPESGDATVLAGFGPSDDPLCVDMNATPDPVRSPNFGNEKLREKTQYDFSVALRNLPDNPSGTNGIGYRCLINGKPVAYFRGTTLTTRPAKTSAYLQDRTKPYSATTNFTKRICIEDAAGTEIDEATPYALQTNPSPAANGAVIDWHNANSFQLIHPGADGVFAGPPDRTKPNDFDRPIAVTDGGQFGLTAEDLDNITNCGSSATVQGLIGK